MNLNIHSIAKNSYANGPGLRYVVWFQGCTLNCPGCYNPDTHSQDGNSIIPPSTLFNSILHVSEKLEGITITGGEPFQQPQGLLLLLTEIKQKTNLSAVVFSGYTISEIKKLKLGSEILNKIDVLIAGRYNNQLKNTTNLLGSLNQQLHFLTNRYTISDFGEIPQTEIIIDAKGNITFTGINPFRV